MSAFSWVVAAYVFVMLVTLGHFYRLDKHLTKKHAVCILFAPIWWIVAKGVSGTLHTMGKVVYENHLLWAVGFIAAGHFMAKAQCSSLTSCADLGIESAFLSLPPVAFVYWGYIFGAG